MVLLGILLLVGMAIGALAYAYFPTPPTVPYRKPDNYGSFFG